MTKKEKYIDEIKQKAVPILKKAGVTRSSLFGSVARGETEEKSDVDFLIEFPDNEKYTLFDLVELQENLESALGREVDVVTYRSLHHLLKDRILREQVSIYE